MYMVDLCGYLSFSELLGYCDDCKAWFQLRSCKKGLSQYTFLISKNISVMYVNVMTKWNPFAHFLASVMKKNI